jgi:hypothetical protein
MKTTKFIGFPNQNENKGKSNSKIRLWNRKTKPKTWHVQNKNPTRFYCKEETKNKVKLWEENIPKIDVEQIEGNVRILPLFLPIGHLIQAMFLKKIPLTCGPCSHIFTHVHPCVAHVHPCKN